MNIVCLKCNSLISPDNIYITTDLAKCDQCGEVLKVSELINHPVTIHPAPDEGSRLVINHKKNGQVELSLSKKGFTPSIILPFAFSIFWLALISIWTWATAQGVGESAFFSAPFWFFGAYITLRTFNTASETQRITLCDESLKIERISPIWTKTFETDLSDIIAIKMKWRKSGSNVTRIKSPGQKLVKNKSVRLLKKTPAIITKEKTEFFFENATGQEQEWIIIVLRKLVSQRKNQ